MIHKQIYIIFSALLIGLGTIPKQKSPAVHSNSGFVAKEKLSEYGFFMGSMADMIPATSVVPYDLNTPLFSNYAKKLRFIQLPAGQTVTYHPKEVFDFPVGTHIIKTFYYPKDFRDEKKGRILLETRVLTRTENGWKALEYVWNDEQTEAILEVAGGRKEVSWVHTDGTSRKLTYVMPNVNQCKSCHLSDNKLIPIGPSARQLNRDFAYADGKQNQLVQWQQMGILTGLPANHQDIPQLAVWDDPSTGDLNSRARALLDINCGNCHNTKGSANTSGLNLDIYEKNPFVWGVYKPPVAAGRGSGNLSHDIEPGKPEESILLYRMRSTDPGVMMPELGRQLGHEEGIKLVSDWIKSLKPGDFAKK
ncbi:MAG: SO2930 family diheme c-type cytochrome [Bacteroidota bacterium]